ncbi:MAG: DNA-3-methyladenine glycosylase I [Candidatus Aminicenantes bacterium]|nr:DNA-3-methyladenine glycosylase I [Candidatus Aminicenantes bacterium]
MENKKRCEWVPLNDPLYVKYHDEEWGVPVHDDRLLFEALILDGAQAGLSWITILRRRENYRQAYDNFDPQKVARYGEEKIAQLLADAGIIRNRRKVESSVNNARVFLEIQKECASFDKYIWQFVGGKTKINRWESIKEMPATSPESEAMSKDLKKRGFKFAGPTICYAFMQAAGLINDHTVDCFRYREVMEL